MGFPVLGTIEVRRFPDLSHKLYYIRSPDSMPFLTSFVHREPPRGISCRSALLRDKEDICD